MSLLTPYPEGGVTEDAFLGGRLRLRQPAEGYRAAIDPVLLAAAVPATAGQRVADLGCGVATASLCLMARVAGLAVTGLELQPTLAALAEENAALNAQLIAGGARLRVLQGDVASPPSELAAAASDQAGFDQTGFDHVMLNPPYLEPGAVRLPPLELRRIATVEGPATLETWLACALGLLAPRGSLTVIHRADRIERLLSLLAPHCGDIAIFPLWPRRGEAAKRILLQARKGHGGSPRLLAGLVLHDGEGAYTAEAQAVLRDAQGLVWQG